MPKISSNKWRPPPIREGKPLFVGVDHGSPVTIPPGNFALSPRQGGWGPYADTFMRFNEDAFHAIDVRPEITSGVDGPVMKLIPGARAGAMPLKSGLTGEVQGGLIIKPRFGWTGVGQILNETGWNAAPTFLELPLVPGSAREIPPWVIAGPVLARLESLLLSITPGFNQVSKVVMKPRGRIDWEDYLRQPFIRGAWHHLPCSFPELSVDNVLLRQIRWTLERLHHDLIGIGGNDYIAQVLAILAVRLLEQLIDISPLMPSRDDLNRRITNNRILAESVRRGIEAIAWVVDEKGLGGGNEREGLAWALHLDKLWESYVESTYRREVMCTGGDFKVGRLGETVFPLEWTDPLHRTIGHLVPDFVIKRGNSVQVIDAKYKAHLAEAEESGWSHFEDEMREAHRADVHQILAYASLFEAEEVIATLVYPLRQATFDSLHSRGRDRSFAELFHGGRHVRIELRGLPFGGLLRN